MFDSRLMALRTHSLYCTIQTDYLLVQPSVCLSICLSSRGAVCLSDSQCLWDEGDVGLQSAQRRRPRLLLNGMENGLYIIFSHSLNSTLTRVWPKKMFAWNPHHSGVQFLACGYIRSSHFAFNFSEVHKLFLDIQWQWMRCLDYLKRWEYCMRTTCIMVSPGGTNTLNVVSTLQE